MASYKVAQDVEADDKLLGPFSFRQFIYLIAVAMAGLIGYALYQIFPPLVIIPAPIIIFFGALALPLRKDQPMETYLAAIVSFYLKPRKRRWQPDGIESLVEITAPKDKGENRTKMLSGDETEQRLTYLADLADTRGWSIRHTTQPGESSSMVGDIYNEAVRTEDVYADQSGVAQKFDTMISQADTKRRSAMVERMHQPAAPAAAQPAPPPQQPAPASQPAQPQQPVSQAPAPQPTPARVAAGGADQPTGPESSAQRGAFPGSSNDGSGVAADTKTPTNSVSTPHYDPYPNSIHQSVITPISQQTAAPTQSPPEPPAITEPPSTSEIPPSPDIINLANNTDLSIETIAHEASRIRKKQQASDEVVISLR